MKYFHDLSSVPDVAYKLSETILFGNYSNITYYEFHKEINGIGINDFESGFEMFQNQSKDYYQSFISPGFVDIIQAEISIVVMFGEQCYFSRDCGSNFYLGFGPAGILELRKACTEKKILCLASDQNIDEWIIKQNVRPIDFETDSATEERNQFEQIMHCLRRFVIEVQRQPGIYNGFKEEDLRSILLGSLNVAFEGRCNGEAINGNGKTDILIRTKDGRNEHVFELKVWAGTQSLRNAIEQLKGYLAFHNDHCVLFMLSKNKNFHSVISETEKVIELEYGVFQRYGEQEFVFQISKSGQGKPKVEVHLCIVNIYNSKLKMS